MPEAAAVPRHSLVVRVTHWITALCFVALLVSGIEIVISHPRFYWGETGNVKTPALFQLPIPASRSAVDTGYGYVLPDQNGWSRSLHFQTAWILVFAGLFYSVSGLRSGHFRKNLLADGGGYNALQRLTYLAVVFGLFPLMIWTGLAMSPGFTSAFPATVDLLGGQQSARTIHFIVTGMLVVFTVGHLAMVAMAGFGRLTRAMITGSES